MTDAIHQAIKESETKRMEREILSAVDRRYYDMRHPNWRYELKEYMEKASKPKPIQTGLTTNTKGN